MTDGRAGRDGAAPGRAAPADAGSPPEFAAAVAAAANDRATIYSALSFAFYAPDEALVRSILDGSWAAAVGSAIGWLGHDAARYGPGLRAVADAAARLGAEGPEAAARRLRVAYAALFEGPGVPAVVPFEAWWADHAEGGGPLNGPATARVAMIYRENGLGRAAGHPDFPDHVATELEFCHAMCAREAKAWARGDVAAAAEIRRATDAFLRAHPGRWWPRLAAAVRRASQDSLYAGLADLLEAHLSIEVGAGMGRDDFPWSS